MSPGRLLAAGIDVTGVAVDTAVVAYLLDPSDGQVTLDELAERDGLRRRRRRTAGQLGFDLERWRGGRRRVSEYAATPGGPSRAALRAGTLMIDLDAVGERRCTRRSSAR